MRHHKRSWHKFSPPRSTTATPISLISNSSLYSPIRHLLDISNNHALIKDPTNSSLSMALVRLGIGKMLLTRCGVFQVPNLLQVIASQISPLPSTPLRSAVKSLFCIFFVFCVWSNKAYSLSVVVFIVVRCSYTSHPLALFASVLVVASPLERETGDSLLSLSLFIAVVGLRSLLSVVNFNPNQSPRCIVGRTFATDKGRHVECRFCSVPFLCLFLSPGVCAVRFS